MPKWQHFHKPFDGLCLHECSVCHHFHPWFHLFGCVSAKIVRPHVGMCCLFLVSFFWRKEATDRKKWPGKKKKKKKSCFSGRLWKWLIKYTIYFSQKDLQISAVNPSPCYRTYCELCISSKVALFAHIEAPTVYIRKQKNRVFSQKSKNEFHH